MPINPDLLIFSNDLQSFYVDKCGNPLSGGILTAYVDDSRTTLKNIYYQANIAPDINGKYTYIPLPNPLTLSAAGSIADVSGHDVLIGWYPVEESDNITPQLYYVTMTNACGELQWTRSGFPYGAESGIVPPPENDVNVENYVINNRLWRNNALVPINATTLGSGIGGTWTTQYNNSGTYYHVPIAPSQHDGFSMPDIQFIKNVNGAADTITVLPFANGLTETFTDDIAGEYYINFSCTGTQSGETLKCFQWPISLHNNTLSGVPFTFTIQAQSISGTSVISASIYQFAGTGNASAVPVLIGSNSNIQLNTAWEKITISSVFPVTSGLPAVTTFDDGLYLQINMPLASAGITNLNFALPSIYLTTTEIPSNDFQTYDQIGAIIDSPRLGDIRTSLNDFSPFGWDPMNDGTIGNASSNATTRANADQWRLFNLIWNLAAPYNVGTANQLAQMYNSSGAAVTYGATALADFTSNNQLALTKSMGKVFLGTVPLASLLAATPTVIGFQSIVTASSSSGLLLTTATANLLQLFVGNTVTFANTGGTLPTNIVANYVYYVIPISATTFKIANSFANAIAGTAITFGASAGTGTTTAYLSLTSSVEGEYSHTQLATELVQHTHNATPANFVDTGTGGVFTTGASGGSTGVTGGVTGYSAQSAFNVTQPGTFMNIYIKF